MSLVLPLIPPTDITASGVGQPVPVGGMAGFGEINVLAYTKAGTNPTLAVALQHSLPLSTSAGPSFAGAGGAGLSINSVAATDQGRAVLFTTGAAAQTIAAAILSFFITGAPVGTLTVGLYATAAGVPTGAALATGTIPIASITGTTAATANALTAVFSSTYELAANTTYALAVSASYAASNANFVSVLSTTVANSGNAATNNGAWAATATSNITFGTGVYSFSAYSDYQVVTPGTAQALTPKSLGSFTTGTAAQPTPFYPQNTLGVIRAVWTIGGTVNPEYLIAASISAKAVNSVPSSSV